MDWTTVHGFESDEKVNNYGKSAPFLLLVHK